MTTRRQHYVWRKYLEPWTVKKKKSRQLWCLRRESPTPLFVDTKNVAVERDFYRLRNLHSTDAGFVRAMAFAEGTNPAVRALNESWISRFEGFLNLLKGIGNHPKTNHAAQNLLDASMIEFQEIEYSRMETHAKAQIAALQAGDAKFYEEDEQAVRFCYFLAHQYFRTKAIREQTRARFKTSQEQDLFDRTWPVLRHVFATNFSYSIFARRKFMRLQVMQAPPNMEFITSDQPVVNTFAAHATAEKPLDELELYYPVSPTRAAIISGHGAYELVHGTTIEPFRLHILNQTIEHTAHEQLFAKSEDVLQTIAPDFCRHAT